MIIGADKFRKAKTIADKEIYNVITLLSHSCEQLKKEKSLSGNEEENYLTNLLVKNYLRINKSKYNVGHLFFEVQSGEIDYRHKTIGYLDIKITNLGNKDLTDEDEYYCFECKRLNKYASSRDKYVKEGIKRFIVGKYSREMQIAGMIGYMQSGDLSKIVDDINKKLRNEQSLKVVKYLTKNNRNKVKNLYNSKHRRNKSLPEINIYHIFGDMMN